MKEKTNNTTTSTGKTIVGSYEELLQIIQQSIEQHNEIRLVNLLVTFRINISTLIEKTGIPKDLTTDTYFVDYPVIVDGLECEEVVSEKITFNKEVVFNKEWLCPFTSKSEIERIAIYDCDFKCKSEVSLRMEDIKCGIFDMIHCTSYSNISFNGIYCSDNFSIEEVEIKGGLSFRNSILLAKKDAELRLEGLVVAKDVEFFNCKFFRKTVLNIETEGSVKFELINYDINEDTNNGSKGLCYGSICMNETTIGKRLVFSHCNIGTIDLINVKIESISEFELRYKRLKNQAATILRNGALQRNDDVAYTNYTADIYDDYLRTISIQKLRRWLHKIDTPKEKDQKEFKKIERKYKRKSFKRKLFEPIRLLLPNFFSEEGWLLWLNKYSNNYNRSWFRGVVFTCVIAFVWYFALNYWGMQEQYFVIDRSFRGFGEVFEGYLSLLDIFNLIGDKPAFELTPIGKGMMLLAKIIIAYGEWQTIYAFYKYKK